MKNHTMHIKWVLLSLLFVFLASCSPIDSSLSELASTYAAQTRTAMQAAENEAPQPTEMATPEPTETEAFTPTPLPTLAGPVGPDDFPENVNPLTGQMVADPEILDRRPVFVKVANYPTSGRPHAGLSFADMVFEYYIGYGGNRFSALYYGQNIDQIGPVRSGRVVDPYIVNLYEGILGMEGAYVTIFDHIRDILGNRIVSGRDTCPAICDDGRNIVISVFANSEAMSTVAEKNGVVNRRYALEGMTFDPQVPDGGEDGDQAAILFSSLNRGEWRFDEESGQYLRWIEDTSSGSLKMIPLVDRVTEEQLAFSNVIVIFANHTEVDPAVHEIDLWDNATGERAVVFRDGQAFDISWATPDNDQPIRYFDEDGDLFPLKPGNTWVVIFGLRSGVTEDDGQWTFNFRMP